MPAAAPLIGAIAGQYIGAALGYAAVGGYATTAFNAFIGRAIGGMIGSTIGSSLGQAVFGKEPDLPDYSTALADRGILVNTRTAASAIPVVYGSRRVGGNIVFIESSGENNKYLHLVLVLSEGEVSSIGDVYLNDKISTDTQYSGKVNIYKHTGADDQAADSNLVADVTNWTTDHKLSGVAYLYVRLEYDQDAFPGGIPTITAEVDGIKIYDPRTTTSAFSNNPALCIRDYLTNDRYGRGIDSSLIDDASFIAAANYCEETVTLGGASVDRYTCDGVIDTSRTSIEILKELLTACKGFLIFSGGKYKLVIDKPETATFTFSEDNIVGGWSIGLGSKQNTYNRIRASFFNVNRSWQEDIAVVESTALRTQDNGLLLEREIMLPFTNTQERAEAIATMALNQSRQQVSCEFTATIEGLRCEVGDVVYISHATPGWDTLNSGAGKKFRIIEIALMNSDEVRVKALEYDATVYNFGTISAADATPNTNLPDLYTVNPVTNLTVTQLGDVLEDGTFQSGVLVTWDASTSGFIRQYEVQWKRGSSEFDYGLVSSATTGTDDFGLITGTVTEAPDYGLITDPIDAADAYWNSIFVTDLQCVINNVFAGQDYSIRVRAINTAGVRSAWVTDTISPLPDTTPPEAPEYLSAVGGFRQIQLYWQNPLDADFDRINVYRNTTNNLAGATLIGTTKGTRYLDAGLGINQTFYYWIRALDRTGNISDPSSGTNATTAFVDSDDFSAEVMNLFSEAGAYGIEPVSSLPASGDFDGQIKFDTTNVKLWRWDAATSSWSDDIFSISAGSVDAASFAAGIEPVSVVASLPSPTGYTGPNIVFNTGDGKLYRYDSATPAFTAAVPTVDLVGDLSLTNFPASVRPIEIVASLPITGNSEGRMVYLTSDNKLYRYNGTSWITGVASTDIDGTIADAQIAAISATKIGGQITSTQIADDAITTPKLAAGAVTASEIATGTIQAGNIASGAITTAKLAADAVTADKIDAGAVTADAIAAGSISAAAIATNAITAEKVAAGAITATKIATDAVTADKIAANSITSSELAANSVIAGKIAAGAINASALFVDGIIEGSHIKAGTIQSNNIAANSITGGLIAASGIITSAAQIEDGLITNAKIVNGAITTAKITDANITTLKIAGNAVTQPVTYTNESVIAVATNTSAWTTVASVTVDVGDADGATLSNLIGFSFRPYNTTGGAWLAWYRVLRGTTELVIGQSGIPNNTDGPTLSSFVVDSGVSGSNTYYIQSRGSGDTGQVYVEARRAYVVGAKR
jgi:hypothetical protein